MHIPLDHLVYAAPDLDLGMREIERLTGISPTLGGQHHGRGTRNALIALGTDSYLEIIAPDADQPPPTAPRWFGVDTVIAPRLTTWAAKATGLRELQALAVAHGVSLGEVQSGTRQRADGLMLSWLVTNPEPLLAGGVIPFFIDWGESPHPAASATRGASLVALRVEHPDVSGVRRMLRVLDLDVEVSRADDAALVAIIDTPRGRIEVR